MNRRSIGFRQILRAQLSAIFIMLALGCTSTYKIEYSVTSSNSGIISSEDVVAIRQSLLNDPKIVPATNPNSKPTDLANRFYLSRHIEAHEILTIKEKEDELILSVSRLTKSLGDFSAAWMSFFERKMKNTIERATDKTVEFNLLPR